MSMQEFKKGIFSLTDTPFGYTLSMIGGKWRLVILYWLVEYKTIRFNELHRKIGTITYKTLSTELKAMESDGLILRKEYPQIPPRVEYSLSEKGRSLFPIMEDMCQWGLKHSGKWES
ncbi:MAG: helix-turn-helix transcriptional regulator [Ruminococcus sp.]|nr:helix-turn-helix transcriptional regulator [Ruminococcus sp.]